MRTDIRTLVLKGYPTILSWNRLEGRPRKNAFDRSLKAEVRDPLWMLSRQWQMGEFKGDDAGSPVFMKTKMHTTKLTRYKSRKGEVVPFEKQVPLEAKVEKELLSKTYQLSTEIARYWFKLLSKAGIGTYRDQYITTYPFELPPYEKYQHEIYAHKEVWQSLQALSGRYMDGYAFIQHIGGGDDAKNDITVSSGDEVKIDEAADKLLSWYRNQYYQGNNNAESDTWEPSQLEYQFECSAPEGTDRQVVLKAEEYYRGHLDWYSFKIDDTSNGLQESADVTIDDNVQQSMVLTHLPSPVEFGGMPATRWWEMEDARTDFGDIDANTTDVAKLLLIEFGLVYANDWFVIPFELPEGTLAEVQGVRVTDCFGRNFWIEAAGKGAENQWQRWNMYTLDKVSDTGMADSRLFIPPAIGKLMQSPAIEKVNLIRDEMANMVWGIENEVLLANGDHVPGIEAARETREHISKFVPPAPEPPESPEEAAIKYKIQTSVPENWIPFIPVHVDGSNREVQLQRAAMLRTLDGDSDTPKIEPRSQLLREGMDEGEAYYIYEEEVPKAGAIVERSFQRARWHNGKVYTWVGRRKRWGRGQGSSGLAFDIIQSTKK